MMKERLSTIKRRFAAGEDVTEELLRLAEDLMDLNEDLGDEVSYQRDRAIRLQQEAFGQGRKEASRELAASAEQLSADPESTAQHLIAELGREGATEVCAQLLVRLTPATRPTTTELLQRLGPRALETSLIIQTDSEGSRASCRLMAPAGTLPAPGQEQTFDETSADPETALRSVLIQLPRRT